MKKLLLLVVPIFLFVQNIANCDEKKFEENNYIKIERNELTLKSRLADLYVGYEYTIKNVYNEPIQIKNIYTWNNTSGKVAYLSVKKANKTAAAETINKGKKLASRTLGLSLIPYVIASPFSAWSNDIGNSNAEKESLGYNIKPITNYELAKGEILKFRTLTIPKYTPIIKITYKNPITDEYMDIVLK